MSAFWGMDTEQVREHAERLRTASGQVEDLRGRLETLVRGVSWEGPDAEDFRGRWEELAAGRLTATLEQLEASGERALGEADQQDVVSDADGTESGPAENPSTLPPGQGGDGPGGYRSTDNPWIPNWLEDPAESLLSGLASTTSNLLGWGFDTGIDLLEGGLGALGVNTDGIAQFQRDANHLGGVLTDWATGERVPTISELGASSLLALGSAGVGVYEAITGEDTAFLDDRPGGQVSDVTVSSDPSPSPQTLQDLILDNTALRIGHGDTSQQGQIGIQEVRSADGSEPSYIVQVPPTEGDIGAFPDAYGGQANSRDWASNLRLVAGQDTAATQDVRAALEAAGVPAGANVMLVGHSQGGIVANNLAADPAFNNADGSPGSYNVTHTFSVGSPVQTTIPAQGSTESVNVSHEGGLHPGPSVSGDPIPGLDLGGAQVDGGSLGAPNRHEVSLPGYPTPISDPMGLMNANHDSTGPNGDPDGGYAGTVARNTATDPTLSALQDDLSGVYLGDDTYVARSTVVEVGRGEHGG